MTHNPIEDQANPTDGSQSVDEVMASEDAVETATEQHVETRDEEMERLRSEVADANNRVLMAQADLENFRKRMRRDLEDQIKFAPIAVVNDLLQVRDNLVRAVEAAIAGDAAASNDGLREGVKMLVKQFDDTLAKHSITAIASVGQTFDPHLHQAISQMPSAEVPAGSIAYEAVTGFEMHGRVIRPSQVIVSTGPA